MACCEYNKDSGTSNFYDITVKLYPRGEEQILPPAKDINHMARSERFA